MMETVYSWLPGLAAGFVLTWPVAFGAFKKYAEKWLDGKFAERLQSLRHTQDIELVGLRLKIDSLLDRNTKLHQLEFDALPEAWAKVNAAFWKAREITAAMRSYANLDAMPVMRALEVVKRSKLTQPEINEVMALESKNAQFAAFSNWHDFQDARTKAQDAYKCSLEKGIFFDPALNAKFKEIHDLVWNALIEWEMNVTAGVDVAHTERRVALMAGEANLIELEELVRARLASKEQSL